MKKNKTTPQDFEEAVKMLEEIVQKLESSDLKLDESLELFQKGVELSNFCGQKLTSVENQVEKIIQSANGELTFSLFDVEED